MHDTLNFDSLSFKNVKIFEFNYSDSTRVKKVYLVKNIGIIQFEMVNGEIWLNKNLSDIGENTIESFDYFENTCE